MSEPYNTITIKWNYKDGELVSIEIIRTKPNGVFRSRKVIENPSNGERADIMQRVRAWKQHRADMTPFFVNPHQPNRVNGVIARFPAYA